MDTVTQLSQLRVSDTTVDVGGRRKIENSADVYPNKTSMEKHNLASNTMTWKGASHHGQEGETQVMRLTSLPIDPLSSALSPTISDNSSEFVGASKSGPSHMFMGPDVIKCTRINFPCGSISFPVDRNEDTANAKSYSSPVTIPGSFQNSSQHDRPSKQTSAAISSATANSNDSQRPEVFGSGCNVNIQNEKEVEYMGTFRPPPPQYHEALISLGRSLDGITQDSAENTSQQINSSSRTNLPSYSEYMRHRSSSFTRAGQNAQSNSSASEFGFRSKKERSAPPVFRSSSGDLYKLSEHKTPYSSINQQFDNRKRRKLPRQTQSLDLPDSGRHSHDEYILSASSIKIPQFDNLKLSGLSLHNISPIEIKNNYFKPIKMASFPIGNSHSSSESKTYDDSAEKKPSEFSLRVSLNDRESLAGNIPNAGAGSSSEHGISYLQTNEDRQHQRTEIRQDIRRHNNSSHCRPDLGSAQSKSFDLPLGQSDNTDDFLKYMSIREERRPSAQSLPDLSGPALDALCPDDSKLEDGDLKKIDQCFIEKANELLMKFGQSNSPPYSKSFTRDENSDHVFDPLKERRRKTMDRQHKNWEAVEEKQHEHELPSVSLSHEIYKYNSSSQHSCERQTLQTSVSCLKHAEKTKQLVSQSSFEGCLPTQSSAQLRSRLQPSVSPLYSAGAKMHLETVSMLHPTPHSSPFYGQEGDFAVVEMSENLKYFSRQPSPDMDVNCVYDSSYLDAMTTSRSTADDGFSELYYENNNRNNIMNANVEMDRVGESGFHSMPLTPPSINVEVAEECCRGTSLMTSSNAIVEALGGLNEDFNLIEDEWSNSLDSILSGIPSTAPLPELVVSNQKVNDAQLKESQSSQCDVENCIPQDQLLNLPGASVVTTAASTASVTSDCTVQCSMSPMSISPGGSSIPSPLTSLRSSFNSDRRFKRSYSSSPQNPSGLDVNTIIRISPNCLMSTPPNGSHENILSSLNGSYGHFIPRPEANNNHAQRSNLNFSSLFSDSNAIPNQSQVSAPTNMTINSSTESSFFKIGVPDKNSSSNSYQQSVPFSLQSSTSKPSCVSVFFNDVTTSMAHSLSPPQGTQSVFSSVSQSPRPQDLTQSSFSHMVASSPPMDQSSDDSPVGDEEGAEEVPRVCRWVDCNAVFSDRASLSRHIERAHVDQRKGDDYTCFWSACQRKYRAFNARYKLLIHMRVHSGEKPNKCTFPGCDKAFSRLENLKIHLRSHTGERPYVCVHHHCNKAFSNSSDRAKHQRTHLDAKPYVCYVPGCLKRYTDPSSLRKHVKNHSARDQLLAKRKSRSSETYSTSRSPLLAPLPPLLPEGHDLTTCEPSSRSDAPSADAAGSTSPTGSMGGDVVRFSLRCHVLSRRPRDIHETTGLPELELASQEDLDLWIS